MLSKFKTPIGPRPRTKYRVYDAEDLEEIRLIGSAEDLSAKIRHCQQNLEWLKRLQQQMQ